MVKKMANDCSLGNGNYPETVEDALQVLSMCQLERQQSKEKKERKINGETFFQQKKKACYCCGQEDHMVWNCPKAASTVGANRSSTAVVTDSLCIGPITVDLTTTEIQRDIAFRLSSTSISI